MHQSLDRVHRLQSVHKILTALGASSRTERLTLQFALAALFLVDFSHLAVGRLLTGHLGVIFYVVFEDRLSLVKHRVEEIDSLLFFVLN